MTLQLFCKFQYSIKIVICDFFLFVVCQDGELDITPAGDSILKAEGENLVLTCQALGTSQSTDSRLKWFDQNDDHVVEENGRYVCLSITLNWG